MNDNVDPLWMSKYLFLKCLNFLITLCIYQRPSGGGGGGGGGGVTPGTYAGMGQDLLTLVTNFKPGMGGMD